MSTSTYFIVFPANCFELAWREQNNPGRERFLDGRQPRRLTLMWFQRNSVPVDWDAQRALVASFEGEP
jgi:hypothetical protein